MAQQSQAATLTVQEIGDDGQQHERIITLSNQVFTIGRSKDNDIHLVSDHVSGHHARIEPDGNSFCFIDIGSTNGTFIGQQRLAHNQPHILNDQDVLSLGGVLGTKKAATLVFKAAQIVAPPPRPTRQTPIHNVAPVAAPASSQPTQIYSSKAPQTQVLTLNNFDPKAKKTTIGREGCNITLNHPLVSRFHAQIDLLDNGNHVLIDAGSTNGTFVNGQRISRCILSRGDIIKIGPFKHTYLVDHLDQYDQRGALRVDARNLKLVVTVKGEKRTILNDVSLSIAPREFVALVGGSGAGKSTLMKAIGGFERKGVKGNVLVNGDDYYANFDSYRTMLGYVPQDDILHRTLPVDNTLEYIARLRLPPDTSNKEMKQQIETVLDAVDMVEHRAKYVEKLSGGQRKRVSIGAELLAEPSLFFLDEPTSGLDPGMEKKMMQTLRKLADNGKTVVLVTHATENIEYCHQVAFMSKGRLIYYGPPKDALSFFGVNTFSEIYTRLDGSVTDPENATAVQHVLTQEHDAWKRQHATEKEPARIEVLWQMKYRGFDNTPPSAQCQHYVIDRLNQPSPEPVAVGGKDTSSKTPRLSPLRQYMVQTARYFDLIVRDKVNLLIMLLQAPIIAVLLWLLANGQALIGVEEVDYIPRIEAQSLLFVLAIVAVWFGINNAAREITKEFPIFDRERISKLNIFSYLFSKITVLGALVFIQNVLLMGILSITFTDHGIEFPSSGTLDLFAVPAWLQMFITMFLTSLAGTSLGLLISSLSKTPDWATSFVPLLLIPQVLFAGLIFKIEEAGKLVNSVVWILSLLMISHWSFDALGTTFNLANMCQLPNICQEYDDNDDDVCIDVASQCKVSKDLENDTKNLDCKPPANFPQGCPPPMPENTNCITKMCVDDMPFLERGIEAPDAFPNAFNFTAKHLAFTWSVLGLFVVVCTGATVLLLRKRG